MMRVPAHARYGGYDADDHYISDLDILPGERIGRPVRRRRGRALLRTLVILLAVVGGTWAYANGHLTWPSWLPTDIGTVLAEKLRTSTEPASRVTSPLEPAIPERIAASPRLAPLPLPAPEPAGKVADDNPGVLTTASIPPAATAPEASANQPLSPPTADPSDPFQVRAVAAGLHPGLSRALLSRLTPADYSNARTAIERALAETSDDAVYTWPRQRQASLAVFKVHFVAGAASGCRRYVVTVTKDRWSTTAPPMEKCGSFRRGHAWRE